MLQDFGIRPLPPQLAKKAAVELKENPDEIGQYLNAMHEWLKTQTNLRARSDNQFLIVFLRCSKYNLEKAKKRLMEYYVYRAKAPELFKNRNLQDPIIEFIIKSGSMLHLPEPCAIDGPRVIMLRPKAFDMKRHTIPDVFRAATLATDYLVNRDDNSMIAGYIMVMDLGDIPKAVFINFNPLFVRKVTILANKMSPARMKGFHFLNVPKIFGKLFDMIKAVINEKLRDRFYVHSSLETLYSHVPKHVLPKEYGGEVNIAEIQDDWWKALEEHEHFLKEEEDYGIIGDDAAADASEFEEKTFDSNYKNHRANSKSEYANSEFNQMQGKFRNLNVD